MIFVTGDTHGGMDARKLDKFARETGDTLTKDDYLIICGDFGFIWRDQEDDGERYWLEKINSYNWTTLFVDGNHENFNALYSRFKYEDWNGGRVHRIRDSIFHLMRGQVFTLNECTFFTMGGARSVDRGIWTKTERKDRGVCWWDEEMPSADEYAEGKKNLAAHGNKVDYIITHDVPANVLYAMSCGMFRPNTLNLYLEEIEGTIEYKKWYCGHHHIDKRFGDIRVLYYDILKISERKD